MDIANTMDRADTKKGNLDATHRRRLPWRATSEPFAIWVSEVMLQQTQVATVIPYYRRFMDRFPTPAHLAAAEIQEVLKLWEGLGYYSRARNLHRAAGVVTSRFNGQVPDDPEAFRSLPGVGDYICAAVLSIAFGRVLPVVDGNVKRVLSRLLEIDTPRESQRCPSGFQGAGYESHLPEAAGRLQPGHYGTGRARLPPEESRLRDLPTFRPVPGKPAPHDNRLPETQCVPKNPPPASGLRSDPEKGENAGGPATIGRIFRRTVGISGCPGRERANRHAAR